MAGIIRAETAGFCMGVDLALKKLDRVVGKGEKKVATLGPIIHNPQVLAYYSQKGVLQVDKVEEVPGDCCVVIRAHGIKKEVEQELLDNGLEIVDATCPKVKKAQLLIREQTEKGKKLLLYGEKDHPEVAGLLSYAANDAQVFQDLQELKQKLVQSDQEEYFMASQTTQNRVEFNECVQYARSIVQDLPVFDTICDTTRYRQNEVARLAEKVDIMVVVGGRNSGNTRRLVHVVNSMGKECVHVETAEELPLEKFRGCNLLGLTAGASTPKNIIDQVEQELSGLKQE
ncbi:MAG: 4-hydroxy-3-methylbut-2-enyl diphosphate reductase [Thermodesulfobacteriota bacterium]